MVPLSRFILLVLACLPFLCNSAIARTIIVQPGGSIRAALGDAREGDRVLVLPGVYHEGAPGDLNALSITMGGIDLIGLSSPTRPVVLENRGDQSFGIWVSPSDSLGGNAQSDPEHPPCGLSGARIDGFSLTGFTVRGFAEDGVHLTCVDSFRLSHNVVDANGVYGVFPIASHGGLVSHNEVMNTTADAGIYVGQSDNVVITANFVHENLLGIEVENSRDCAVTNNDVYGNTLGILVDVMPFLEVGTQQKTLVGRNWVHDNNRPNTAESDDVLSIFPAGIGILLTGADATTITSNTVTGNQFVGVGVVSVCLELSLLGLPCEGLDIDTQSDANRIVRNFARGNGTVPVTDALLDAFRADLAWDGTGTGNCWKTNSFGTSVPAPLPSC